MKKLKFFLTAILALSLLGGSARAAITAVGKDDPNPQAKKICETVAMITGVAISPLMGVSGVGAYRYFSAKTTAEKAALPWFANPWFWIPALLLVAACFAKDACGLVIPPGMKKPFDVLETAEHKISGLVATGAFVPIVAAIFQVYQAGSAPEPSSWLHLGSLGFATINFSALLGNAIMIPIAMAAFFVVFLASNAINVLILISPFGQVDAALKAARTAIIGTIAATSLVNPWVGAAWAIIIILFSWLIAGWSFRLSHFGLAFLWDFFTGRKHRFKPDTKENKLFLARTINKVPPRTYGKLSRNEKGELVLNYRPWLILPQRTLILPAGKYETGRGIFYSEILQVEGDSAKTVMLLPPRYLGHEETVARIYNLAGTRDIGLRAAWAWFKSLFSGKTATA